MPEIRLRLSDVEIVCQVEGEGPVVILAHGFPDCARTFRAQVPALVAAGLRVVVPSLRAYAPSGVARSGRYDAAALGQDLIELADRFSPGVPVRLVGHDWGAIAGYAATALAPARFSHLVTMAVPHLRASSRAFGTAAQLRRSWYIGMFQLRGYAEKRVLAGDMALIDRLWRDWSPGYRAPAEELAAVKAAIRPNLSSVLGYYRALGTLRSLAGEVRRLLFARTEVPALYFHGADDGCVGAETALDLAGAYANGVSTHIVPGAGHFVHLEQPGIVNDALTRFLTRSTRHAR